MNGFRERERKTKSNKERKYHHSCYNYHSWSCSSHFRFARPTWFRRGAFLSLIANATIHHPMPSTVDHFAVSLIFRISFYAVPFAEKIERIIWECVSVICLCLFLSLQFLFFILAARPFDRLFQPDRIEINRTQRLRRVIWFREFFHKERQVVAALQNITVSNR